MTADSYTRDKDGLDASDYNVLTFYEVRVEVSQFQR